MAKRQNNEIERQKLISIYGDPDKIFDQNVFPEPSAPPAYDYQSSPSNNNVLSGPVVPPRNSKPGNSEQMTDTIISYIRQSRFHKFREVS